METSNYNLLFYDITSKCNSDCPICFQKGNSFRDISIEELEKSLKNVKGKEIRLLGGEPTLHPDLCEMIKVIHESGNSAYFATNGIVLSKDKRLVADLFELQKSGKLMINISMNGGLSEKITELLHGKNELPEKLSALYNMKGFKYLSASSVLCRNINEFVLVDLVKIQNMFALKNITFRGEINGESPYKTNEFLYLALKSKIITRKDLSRVVMAGFTDINCKGRNCCIKLIKDGYTIHWYEECSDCWRTRKYNPNTASIEFYSGE